MNSTQYVNGSNKSYLSLRINLTNETNGKITKPTFKEISMKQLGILIALTLTSTIASANTTCDINLTNKNGDILETVTNKAQAMDEACNIASQQCEEIIMTDFEGDESLLCEATAATSEKLDARSCTVRLTGPIGRYTIRRYTAYGYRACRQALRRCERDSYRYRGFKRCLIEYRDHRRGRRGDGRRRW